MQGHSHAPERWNMRGKMKKIIAGIACMTVILSVAGCRSQKIMEPIQDEPVKIPIILTVNPSTGIRNDEELVEAFNKEYEGIYQVEAEWIMETQVEYRNNLKRLNVTDDLPAVIIDLRTLPSFYRLMIEDGRIEDLSPYLEADEEWRNMIEPEVLESCREEDGSIYLVPVDSKAFSCAGIFWNEELFSRAGIEKFPETWDEFWECCDKLQARGITPLSLYTEGSGWAAMLLATAEMADTQEGAEFMEQLYPQSYDNDCIYHMAETLQKMFRYTKKDAIYLSFDEAYNNFITGKAAMLPDGCWMIDRIAENAESQIRFASFPGNKLVSSPEISGWAIASSYDEEVKAGAVEFLKFRSRRNVENTERLFSQNGAEGSRLINDYVQAYGRNPQIVPDYQARWNSVLQEKTLKEALTLFAQNKLLPDSFIEMMNESVAEFNREQ